MSACEVFSQKIPVSHLYLNKVYFVRELLNFIRVAALQQMMIDRTSFQCIFHQHASQGCSSAALRWTYPADSTTQSTLSHASLEST